LLEKVGRDKILKHQKKEVYIMKKSFLKQTMQNRKQFDLFNGIKKGSANLENFTENDIKVIKNNMLKSEYISTKTDKKIIIENKNDLTTIEKIKTDRQTFLIIRENKNHFTMLQDTQQNVYKHIIK
jgi:hypothetical protein